MSDCPFCDYAGPSEILHDWGDAYAIEPIDPVAPGHVLVIPKAHVCSFTPSPPTTAMVMQRAAEWTLVECHGASNLITSDGAAATQTVKHLHVHVVPRRDGDGLQLPWSQPTSLQAKLRAEVERLREVAGVFANAKPSAVEHPLVQQVIEAFAAQQDRLENLLRESEGEAG